MRSVFIYELAIKSDELFTNNYLDISARVRRLDDGRTDGRMGGRTGGWTR